MWLKLFVTPKGDQSERGLSNKKNKKKKENLTSVSLGVILGFFTEP